MTPAQRRLIRFLAELLVARRRRRKLPISRPTTGPRLVSVAKKTETA